MERKGSRLASKTDAVVYMTADRKTLARTAVYIESTGVHLNSMSGMLRIVLETFDTWLDKKGVPEIGSTHEATEILRNMFRASLNPGNRKQRQLLDNLQADEEDFIIEEEVYSRPKIDPRIAQVIYQHTGVKPPRPELTEEQKEKIKAAGKVGPQIQKLTPLEIERGKTIVIVTRQKIEAYKELSTKSKTQKDQDFYTRKVQEVAKFSQRASEGDNEAFRILVDEV